MPEPTKRIGMHSIVISPDDPDRRRTWPHPRATEDVEWRALHHPSSLSDDEVRALARAAGAYRMVFFVSGRDFAPTHSAIRRVLADEERD